MAKPHEIAAEKAKQCRLENKLTLKEVGAHLNASPSKISSWDLLDRRISLDDATYLADLFNISLDWMVGRTEVKEFPGKAPLEFVAIKQSGATVDDTIVHLREAIKPAATHALHKDFLRDRGLDESKLAIIKIMDDSMAGTIDKGDEVLIDRSRRAVNTQDLFAFTVNKAVWVRWIRPEMNGSFTVYAEQPDRYPEKTISKEELDELNILGRIARITKDR